MTKVQITRQNKSIMAVHCSGHAGYDTSGYDIVCAALSSIVQTAALGLMQIVGIDIKFKSNDTKGTLEFQLPNLETTKRLQADLILDTMLLGVSNLHETYSDYIELETNQIQ